MNQMYDKLYSAILEKFNRQCDELMGGLENCYSTREERIAHRHAFNHLKRMMHTIDKIFEQADKLK